MAAPTMTPPAHAPDFLARAGWQGARILPLAGDASFRRYFRVVHEDGRDAVLMDAPPPHEDPRPFISVARHLCAHGFRAPEIFAEEPTTGLVLIEDFGDNRMAEAIAADAARERPIYEAAIDLLKRLHRCPPADLPPYDRATYHREADLLVEWYTPAVGLEVERASWTAAWDEVLGAVEERSVTVLRDYHAENIMLLPHGALGLLDFQDALVGHPAYDLVSLLQDARREVSAELEAEMFARYGRDDDAFRAAYAVLGAQRNAKILGIFVRLWKRDGKAGYLRYQPRMWRYLERDLAHPALAPVAEWLAANIPPSARAEAWLEHAA